MVGEHLVVVVVEEDLVVVEEDLEVVGEDLEVVGEDLVWGDLDFLANSFQALVASAGSRPGTWRRPPSAVWRT